MTKIGCHVSISKSVDLAFDRAKEKTCDVFQVFVKNPRGWSAKILSEEEINQFRSKKKSMGFFPIVAHISYLPNLASQNPEMYEKSIECMSLEIERCRILEIPYFVIHGGSHKGGTLEQGLETYTKSVLKGLEVSKSKVSILIENSSGGKNSTTGSLESIGKIMDEVSDPSKLKLCFDTCHGFGSGYDLRDVNAFQKTKNIIEEHVGLTQLALIHANDSLGELDSRHDRHEHIGLGNIGEKGFRTMINDLEFKRIPWIIETPIDERRNDIDNLSYLRSLKKQEEI